MYTRSREFSGASLPGMQSSSEAYEQDVATRESTRQNDPTAATGAGLVDPGHNDLLRPADPFPMAPSVLVVETYTDLRSAIDAALTRGDLEHDSTADSREAIQKLRENTYSVILLAPRLPIREDPVLHFLHAFQPDELRKVVLMTETEEAVQNESECRVLVKPFGSRQLLESLDLEVPRRGGRS